MINVFIKTVNELCSSGLLVVSLLILSILEHHFTITKSPGLRTEGGGGEASERLIAKADYDANGGKSLGNGILIKT